MKQQSVALLSVVAGKGRIDQELVLSNGVMIDSCSDVCFLAQNTIFIRNNGDGSSPSSILSLFILL